MSNNIYTFISFTSQYIEWSPDSEYILCANLKKAIIQIYSVYNPQWKFKLTEGSAGLQSVTWSPDSKYILTLADFNVSTTYYCYEDLYGEITINNI